MGFLYDFQLKAVDRIRDGCILNGDTGSGKSRTALYYYFVNVCGGEIQDEYKPMKNPKNLLIITTARKRDSLEWEAELLPFLIQPGKNTLPDPYKLNTDPVDFTVIVDSWNNIKKYQDLSDYFIIFDEDRVVGKGAWVKSFLKMTKSNPWILLSATPGDSWSDYIPVFIANGFYRNRTEFTNEHIIWRRFAKFPQVERYINTGRLMRLRRAILVEMNFDRPTEQHHIDINVTYDRLAYKYVWKERKNPEDQEPIINAAGVCYCLRKVVNSDRDRIEKVIELVKERRKVIIFYNFDYELEILRAADYGPDVTVAEMNGHKHQELPQTNKWVYLVQYNSGAEGWNCTSTDSIIFYSQSYSYRVMKQASGRIDRINTPFIDLYYYHIKSKAPIDLAIDRALKNKKKFNESKFIANG